MARSVAGCGGVSVYNTGTNHGRFCPRNTRNTRKDTKGGGRSWRSEKLSESVVLASGASPDAVHRRKARFGGESGCSIARWRPWGRASERLNRVMERLGGASNPANRAMARPAGVSEVAHRLKTPSGRPSGRSIARWKLPAVPETPPLRSLRLREPQKRQCFGIRSGSSNVYGLASDIDLTLKTFTWFVT